MKISEVSVKRPVFAAVISLMLVILGVLAALRLPVREFDWSFNEDAALVLRFVLPRGTFATAVLHELLADAWDAGEGGED